MISGTVTSDREAVLDLTIFDTSQQPHVTRVVIDTGFNGWLTLPPNLIEQMGLSWRRFGHGILADGSEIITDVYEAVVIWDNSSITIPVVKADADPLVGMSLMYGYELVLPILDGSIFTLRRIVTP